MKWVSLITEHTSRTPETHHTKQYTISTQDIPHQTNKDRITTTIRTTHDAPRRHIIGVLLRQ